MAKKFSARFVMILSTILLSACARQAVYHIQTREVVNSPTLPKVTNAPPLLTKEVTPTLSPTFTATTAAIGPKATKTKHEIEFNQIDILGSAPQDGSLKGFLALSDGANNATGRNYLLDLTSGSIHWITDTPNKKYCWGVSPDRDYLLCENADNRMITLLDSQGKNVKNILWKEQWFLFLDWLSNERIQFIKRDHGSELSHTIAYDITNGAEVELVPGFPEINHLEPFDSIGLFSATATFYNASLQLVVYPSRRLTNVLWDLIEDRMIVEVPHTQNPYPAWSPDGEEVIIAGEGLWSESLGYGEAASPELYLADRSDEARKLTTLSYKFPKYSLMDVSWSPNGKRIAFQIDTDDPPCDLGCIMLLDPDSGELEGYEMPIGFGSLVILEPYPRFTWSPDSRYLLLQIYQGEDWEDPELMVFDIDRHLAYPVAKDVRILGWMK